jgi:hypothetical protein
MSLGHGRDNKPNKTLISTLLHTTIVSKTGKDSCAQRSGGTDGLGVCVDQNLEKEILFFNMWFKLARVNC